MIRVSGTGDDGIKRFAAFIQNIKLLLPHHGAVVDVIARRRVVVVGLGHLVNTELPRHARVRVRRPRHVVGVLVDPLLVVARRRHPVVEQDVVPAAMGPRLLRRAAALEQARAGGDVVPRW